MALTEYDFSLFESVPDRAPAGPAIKPRREPMRPVRAPRGPSLEERNARARLVWKRSLISWAIISVVGLCMFSVVRTELDYHQAMVRHQQLQAELAEAQQRNISYRTQIERRYSLEIIQDLALNEYHMVPIEGSRVIYLNIARGDQRIK